jgi:DNA mismatch endonuclease (patch repair protein)
MSRIRCADTGPEIVVRSVLHRMGFRFRKSSSRAVTGRPDVVLPKFKTVVFVHGCFWHRHSKCKFAYTPKSNIAFWQRKFSANVRRDRQVRRLLGNEGWSVVVVWECQTQNLRLLKTRLSKAIQFRRTAVRCLKIKPEA